MTSQISFEQAEQSLQEAVDAGRISEEQAEAALGEMVESGFASGESGVSALSTEFEEAEAAFRKRTVDALAAQKEAVLSQAREALVPGEETVEFEREIDALNAQIVAAQGGVTLGPSGEVFPTTPSTREQAFQEVLDIPEAKVEGGYNLVTALEAGVDERTLRLAGFTDEDVQRATDIRQAFQEVLDIPGAKVEGGYNLVTALEAGVDERTLRLAGFTDEDVQRAQEVLDIPGAKVEGGYNLVTALEAGVDERTLRLAGFTDEDVQRATDIRQAFQEVLDIPEAKVEGGYNLVTALEAGVDERTLRLAGFTAADVARAEAILAAPPVDLIAVEPVDNLIPEETLRSEPSAFADFIRLFPKTTELDYLDYDAAIAELTRAGAVSYPGEYDTAPAEESTTNIDVVVAVKAGLFRALSDVGISLENVQQAREQVRRKALEAEAQQRVTALVDPLTANQLSQGQPVDLAELLAAGGDPEDLALMGFQQRDIVAAEEALTKQRAQRLFLLAGRESVEPDFYPSSSEAVPSVEFARAIFSLRSSLSETAPGLVDELEQGEGMDPAIALLAGAPRADLVTLFGEKAIAEAEERNNAQAELRQLGLWSYAGVDLDDALQPRGFTGGRPPVSVDLLLSAGFTPTQVQAAEERNRLQFGGLVAGGIRDPLGIEGSQLQRSRGMPGAGVLRRALDPRLRVLAGPAQRELIQALEDIQTVGRQLASMTKAELKDQVAQLRVLVGPAQRELAQAVKDIETVGRPLASMTKEELKDQAIRAQQELAQGLEDIQTVGRPLADMTGAELEDQVARLRVLAVPAQREFAQVIEDIATVGRPLASMTKEELKDQAIRAQQELAQGLEDIQTVGRPLAGMTGAELAAQASRTQRELAQAVKDIETVGRPLASMTKAELEGQVTRLRVLGRASQRELAQGLEDIQTVGRPLASMTKAELENQVSRLRVLAIPAQRELAQAVKDIETVGRPLASMTKAELEGQVTRLRVLGRASQRELAQGLEDIQTVGRPLADMTGAELEDQVARLRVLAVPAQREFAQVIEDIQTVGRPLASMTRGELEDQVARLRVLRGDIQTVGRPLAGMTRAELEDQVAQLRVLAVPAQREFAQALEDIQTVGRPLASMTKAELLDILLPPRERTILFPEPSDAPSVPLAMPVPVGVSPQRRLLPLPIVGLTAAAAPLLRNPYIAAAAAAGLGGYIYLSEHPEQVKALADHLADRITSFPRFPIEALGDLGTVSRGAQDLSPPPFVPPRIEGGLPGFPAGVAIDSALPPDFVTPNIDAQLPGFNLLPPDKKLTTLGRLVVTNAVAGHRLAQQLIQPNAREDAETAIAANSPESIEALRKSIVGLSLPEGVRRDLDEILDNATIRAQGRVSGVTSDPTIPGAFTDVPPAEISDIPTQERFRRANELQELRNRAAAALTEAQRRHKAGFDEAAARRALIAEAAASFVASQGFSPEQSNDPRAVQLALTQVIAKVTDVPKARPQPEGPRVGGAPDRPDPKPDVRADPSDADLADAVSPSIPRRFAVAQPIPGTTTTTKTGAAAAGATQPSVVTQPGVAVQPGVVTQPGVAVQPGVVTQPGVAVQPGVVTQPGVAVQPGVVTQPGVAVQPGVVTQPGVAVQPGVVTQPGVVVQPGVVTQPGVAVQPAVVTQPAAITRAATASKPATASRVDAFPRPASLTRPATATKAATTTRATRTTSATRAGAATRPAVIPKTPAGVKRLPLPKGGFRLPGGKKLPKGRFPATVTWPQGENTVTVNLFTGKVLWTDRDPDGTSPTKGFKVTAFSKQRPPTRRIAMGAFDVNILKDGLDFDQAMRAAKKRDRQFRTRRGRP